MSPRKTYIYLCFSFMGMNLILKFLSIVYCTWIWKRSADSTERLVLCMSSFPSWTVVAREHIDEWSRKDDNIRDNDAIGRNYCPFRMYHHQ